MKWFGWNYRSRPGFCVKGDDKELPCDLNTLLFSSLQDMREKLPQTFRVFFPERPSAATPLAFPLVILRFKPIHLSVASHKSITPIVCKDRPLHTSHSEPCKAIYSAVGRNLNRTHITITVARKDIGLPASHFLWTSRKNSNDMSFWSWGLFLEGVCVAIVMWNGAWRMNIKKQNAGINATR